MSFRNAVATSFASALLVLAFSVAPALAADDLSGQAVVRGKDTRRNTVKLGDRTFRLDSESVIRDASGARVALHALSVPDFGRGGADLMLGALVGRYVAVQRSSGFVLRSLDLVATTH
ncbi:MAG: hypothetical protein QF570_22350 [Myxococcota bacterium]|jgi:hypothetical protein|nr:hypothetical protein [Myxococcota bacterium]